MLQRLIEFTQSSDASTDTRHDDAWGCPAHTTCTILAPAIAIPFDFHLTLDGDVLDDPTGKRNYVFLASYGTSFGDLFQFEIERDGSGAQPFVQASFNGRAVAVTTTATGLGNIHFAIDTDIAVLETFRPNVPPSFSDSQEVSLQVSSLGGPEVLDALHTFAVSITSQDPDFAMESADGRVLTAASVSPVPEPSTAGLLGSGVAVLAWLRSRRQGGAGPERRRSGRRRLFRLALVVLATCGVTVARADGFSSASEARNFCQAGGANTPAKLRSCCDDSILVDPMSKQRRLVNECVTGTRQEKSAEESAAERDAKERAKAEREERAANPNAKASKSLVPRTPTADASGAEPAPPAAPSAAAQASASKAGLDCQTAQGRNMLSQLGDIARRMGRAVPDVMCPTMRP